MANVKVSLYQPIKVAGKWTFRKTPEQRLRRLSGGGYHIRIGKRMEPAWRDPGSALAALRRKQADLTFLANGGSVKPDESKAECPKRGERYLKCRCIKAGAPPAAVSIGRGASLAVRFCAPGIGSSATA
jgi:hypothetical protein